MNTINSTLRRKPMNWERPSALPSQSPNPTVQTYKWLTGWMRPLSNFTVIIVIGTNDIVLLWCHRHLLDFGRGDGVQQAILRDGDRGHQVCVSFSPFSVRMELRGKRVSYEICEHCKGVSAKAFDEDGQRVR